MEENFDSFYHLMFLMIDRGLDTGIESIKQFLKDINHEEKDNASFAYEFFKFMKEPICIKPTSNE